MSKPLDPYFAFCNEIPLMKPVWHSLIDADILTQNVVESANAVGPRAIYILKEPMAASNKAPSDSIEALAETLYTLFKSCLLQKAERSNILDTEEVGAYIEISREFDDPSLSFIPDPIHWLSTSPGSGFGCERHFEKRCQKRPDLIEWHDQKRDRKLLSRLSNSKRICYASQHGQDWQPSLERTTSASSIEPSAENQRDTGYQSETLISKFQILLDIESKRELSSSEKCELLEIERKLDHLEMSSDTAQAALTRANASLDKLNELVELNKKLLEFLR